jgi:hypothetical protein
VEALVSVSLPMYEAAVVTRAGVVLWLSVVVLLVPHHVAFQVPVQLPDQGPVGNPPVEYGPVDEAARVIGPTELEISNVVLASAGVVVEG